MDRREGAELGVGASAATRSMRGICGVGQGPTKARRARAEDRDAEDGRSAEDDRVAGAEERGRAISCSRRGACRTSSPTIADE
jgi:hypothetical protein